jgi:hypothetical protein
MGDQPVGRPLLTHKTQTQNKRTDIHDLDGIRTHYLNVQVGEDYPCLRPRSHCDRHSHRTTGRYIPEVRTLQITEYSALAHAVY